MNKWSTEYIQGISDQQLLVLYVAANYKLRRNRIGWWAVGYQVLINISGLTHHL